MSALLKERKIKVNRKYSFQIKMAYLYFLAAESKDKMEKKVM